MVTAEARTLIARPTEQVFVFVAVDFVRNYPRWSREVERMEALSQGPLQVGWMGRQVRVDKGRRTQSTFRVVTFDSGRQLTFHGTDDPFKIDYRFDALGDRTHLSFNFELGYLNPGLRPFVGLVRRVIQESADRMMLELKALIEHEIAPTTDN
ncbi:SRPBCC family protein [Thiocystis violacea]|uniref:SRPBCC family protein n=1 Tax=Thiocystis violacea TaxID=13725 RepID=UPI00190333DA|nr:SRPBCC family protein [Thiocystis violacea]MBK1718756.1 polyketide cyclase [Thiocystis violacea]